MKDNKIYVFTPRPTMSVSKNRIKTDKGIYEVFSIKPIEGDYYIIYSVKMEE